MSKFPKRKLNNKMQTEAERITDSPFLLVGILLLIFFVYLTKIGYAEDSDMLFIISTGREILKHGISYTNNMTWVSGLKTIYQQWAYAVGFAWAYDHIGKIACFFVTTTNIILLSIPIYKTARLKNDQAKSFFIMALLLVCVSPVVCPRPALLTAALLMWQIYICESNKNEWWILLLVLIEANFHSSYIAFHFVYLLPYMVPGITKYLTDESNFKKYIKIIPAMIIVSLANPYGLRGALYLYYSYDGVKNMGIEELQELDFFSGFPLILFILGTIVLILIVFKLRSKIPSPAFYSYIGTIALIALFPVYKNLFFVAVGFNVVTSFVIKDIKIKINDYWPEILIATILLIVVCFRTYPQTIKDVNKQYPESIATYLQKEQPKRLFTSFNDGAIAEFAGAKCFVDARPELHLKKLNGKADTMFDAFLMENGDDTDRYGLMNEYKFDYLLTKSESPLSYWADYNMNLVMTDYGYMLYKSKE